MPRERENLIGQKFGRLTVLEAAEDYIQVKRNRHGEILYIHAFPRWLCQCECGTRKIVLGHHLKSGVTRSCGCLRDELFLHIKK